MRSNQATSTDHQIQMKLRIFGIIGFLFLLFGGFIFLIYLTDLGAASSLNKAKLYAAAGDCRQLIDQASAFYKEKGRAPNLEEIKSMDPFNRTGHVPSGSYLLYFEGIKDDSPCFSAVFFNKYGVVTVESDKKLTIKETR